MYVILHKKNVKDNLVKTDDICVHNGSGFCSISWRGRGTFQLDIGKSQFGEKCHS